MGMEQGWAVIKGYRFPIAGMRLAHGQLLITATAPGPIPPMVNEPVTVFGGDGTGICQGDGGSGFGLSFAGCRKGEFANVTIRLRMDICN